MQSLIVLCRAAQLVGCIAAVPQHAGVKRKLEPEANEESPVPCHTDDPMIPVSKDDLFATMRGSIKFFGVLAESCEVVSGSLERFKNDYQMLCSARFNACLEGTLDPDAAVSDMSSEDHAKHTSLEADRKKWDVPYSNLAARKEILAALRKVLRGLLGFQKEAAPFKDLFIKRREVWIDKNWKSKAYEGERLNFATTISHVKHKTTILKIFKREFDRLLDRSNCMQLGPDLFGKYKFVNLVCLNNDEGVSMRKLTKELVDIFWGYHHSIYELYENRKMLLVKYKERCAAYVESSRKLARKSEQPNSILKSSFVTEVVNNYFAPTEAAFTAYIEKLRYLQEAVAQKIQDLGGLPQRSSK
ncbi:hypothetical protein PAPHI01_1485 [Pancytospora philotis]|nr:hypothetical protein PAPHI01_1485 [Pancytospora philotis]